MKAIRYALSGMAATCMLLSAGAGARTATAPTDYARILADPRRSAENRAMDEGRKPAAVLAWAGIRPGDTVADYGAGGGYYSELIAAVVGPKGRVLALGSPRFYKAEAWAKLTAAHPNVVPVISANLDLAPGSVDMVFTHLVFHDLFLPAKPGEEGGDSAKVIANWFAAVKPGGHVVIADHWGPAGNVSQIAGSLHRIDPAAAKAAMLAAGFVANGDSNMLRRSEDQHDLKVFDPKMRGRTDRFLLLFRRP